MRPEVGVVERRWATFLSEPWPDEVWEAEFGSDDVDDADGVERLVDQIDEPDPAVHPFGKLELRSDSTVPARDVVNEILRLVRVRKIELVGDDLRSARARLMATRCHFPHDLAVHEIACAIAEFALGDHEAINDRVDLARSLDDCAFVAAGAMLIALGNGNVVAARAFASQAVELYPNDPTILYQAADIFRCLGDYRAAVDTMSTLFELAEKADVSWSYKRYLASRIEWLSDLAEYVVEHDISADDLCDAVAVAVTVARSNGYDIYGIELFGGIVDATIVEVHINACHRQCFATSLAMYDAMEDRYDQETDRFVCIGYRGDHFRSVAGEIEEVA